MRVKVGSRVLTPVGPGIVQAVHEEQGLGRLIRPRPMFVVLLDKQGHCSYFKYAELGDPEERSSRAENQAEALEVERHQEEKHGAA